MACVLKNAVEFRWNSAGRVKVAKVWRNRLECFSRSNVGLKEPFSLITLPIFKG